jgi:tetratricopeptide (TPR) repeat protein
MAQAMIALRQESADGNDQAIGLLRRVVALRPDHANGWGALALAYALAFHGRGERNFEVMFARARAAAGRALELDPRNGYARAAVELLRPHRRHWLERERGYRAAIADHPQLDFLLQGLSAVLASVGRNREASELLDRAVTATQPSPGLLYRHARALWAAERLEDADQAIERAIALYPTHYAIWFTRYYILLYSGRADQALAFGAERARRPSGIAEGEFDNIFAVARAILSRRPRDIDEAISRNLASAPRGAGYCENMMQFAAALGRPDTAFLVADAYYFDRGFEVADVRFDAEQRSFSPHGDRNTDILFFPSTSAMRGDPRMTGLLGALGLTRYWAEAGVRPDYQRRQT